MRKKWLFSHILIQSGKKTASNPYSDSTATSSNYNLKFWHIRETEWYNTNITVSFVISWYETRTAECQFSILMVSSIIQLLLENLIYDKTIRRGLRNDCSTSWFFGTIWIVAGANSLIFSTIISSCYGKKLFEIKVKIKCLRVFWSARVYPGGNLWQTKIYNKNAS